MPAKTKVSANLSRSESLANELLSAASIHATSVEERLPISFLKQVEKVLVCKSQYKENGCFARIFFKNGKSTSMPLDYYIYADPGDQLNIKSLRFKFIEGAESTFKCITGTVL